MHGINLRKFCWLSIALSCWAGPLEAQQLYVPPKLFPGVLFVSTAEQLHADQRALLIAEFRSGQRLLAPSQDAAAAEQNSQENPQRPAQVATQSAGQLAGRLLILGPQPGELEHQRPMSLQTLVDLKWSQAPHTLLPHTSSTLPQEPNQEPNHEPNQGLALLQEFKQGDCVWIDAGHIAAWPSEQTQDLAKALSAFLDRGGLIYVEAINLIKPNTDRMAAPGLLPTALQLLPEMIFVHSSSEHAQSAAQSAAQQWPVTNSGIAVRLPHNGWLRFHDREVVNLSIDRAADCQFQWPPTIHYPETLTEDVARGRLGDLVAFRRAWYERQYREFPASIEYRPQLSGGSLVIVGGGRTSPEIWKRFVDLAGGAAARIVVLPTAVPEPTEKDGSEEQIFRRYGAAQVQVLPQIDRQAVSSPEFLDTLRQATGVWFGGGRQWRFVDAYWGTPAWDELKQLLARGGVVGGSSAGATIQGDLLVRGHPLGNQIMIADGYRRGLGLLPGVAIDQHFRQRNRFNDLARVVARYPSIYGIGIDEATALVVQPPNRCQVIGEGSVWLSSPAEPSRQFKEYTTGQEFELQ